MKWTVVFFGFAICLAGSLVTLCILVLAGVSVGWWWLIPAGCVCLLGVSGSRMVREQMAAVRNAFRDFLENGVALRPVDSADFPPEYVEKIVQAADELVAAGMICEGDFQGPEERMALEKKKFRRILRSSDGTLWAEVAAMRPKFPARCLMYLFGYGRYCRRASVEISSFFADCSMMDVVNGKKIAGMREIPGVRFEWRPGEEPRKLLWTALELRRKIEDGGRNPALPFSLEAFAETSQRWALYSTIRNSTLPPPTDGELRREKFSDAAIAKFRQCGERPASPVPDSDSNMPMRPKEDVSPVESVLPAELVSPESAPIPVEIPLSNPSEAIELEEAARFKRAVANLGIMTLLSAVNMILIVSGAEIMFPFSAFFPTLAVTVGAVTAMETKIILFTFFGLGVALSSILMYAACWALAKKIRCFILIAFLLFTLDSLLLLPFIPEGGASIWIDVAFHVWVLLSLFSGVRAWWNLRRGAQ